MSIRTVRAVRYVTPLREGGSLPAVVEADDGNLYVMKFVGAGQGPKALIAEVIAGQIARQLSLRVPELVFVEMEEGLGRSEPNAEIQDLLNASIGLNFGMEFLSGAAAYNPLLAPAPDPELASTIVWFDSYVTNVDRTPRNVNMLIWEQSLWLIDHGACLYFHHDWSDWEERVGSPFQMVRTHTLLPFASRLSAVDRTLRTRLNRTVLEEIVAEVPDEWLGEEEQFTGPAEHRQAYVEYLDRRRNAADHFVREALDARADNV